MNLQRRLLLARNGVTVFMPAIVRREHLMATRTPCVWRITHTIRPGFPTAQGVCGSTWHQDNGTHQSRWKCMESGMWVADQELPPEASPWLNGEADWDYRGIDQRLPDEVVEARADLALETGLHQRAEFMEKVFVERVSNSYGPPAHRHEWTDLTIAPEEKQFIDQFKNFDVGVALRRREAIRAAEDKFSFQAWSDANDTRG